MATPERRGGLDPRYRALLLGEVPATSGEAQALAALDPRLAALCRPLDEDELEALAAAIERAPGAR